MTDKKEALKNFESYIPKELWSSFPAEKLMGLSQLKQSASKTIERLLNEKNASVDQRKLEFLNTIEAKFQEYYHEHFTVNLRYLQV